jgi:hypothetical protein
MVNSRVLKYSQTTTTCFPWVGFKSFEYLYAVRRTKTSFLFEDDQAAEVEQSPRPETDDDDDSYRNVLLLRLSQWISLLYFFIRESQTKFFNESNKDIFLITFFGRFDNVESWCLSLTT